jgi:hypothetical protein
MVAVLAVTAVTVDTAAMVHTAGLDNLLAAGVDVVAADVAVAER